MEQDRNICEVKLQNKSHKWIIFGHWCKKKKKARDWHNINGINAQSYICIFIYLAKIIAEKTQGSFVWIAVKDMKDEYRFYFESYNRKLSFLIKSGLILLCCLAPAGASGISASQLWIFSLNYEEDLKMKKHLVQSWIKGFWLYRLHV